ncbi:MAG: hypothetical protein RIS35_1340, partial [Pseudomonadota bacterium]
MNARATVPGTLLSRPRPSIPPGLGVVIACLWVQSLAALPTFRQTLAMAAIGTLLLGIGVGCALRSPGGRLAGMLSLSMPACGAALLAAALAVHVAQQRLDERIPPAFEGVTLTVTGLVEDMPQRSKDGVRFRFTIESCTEPAERCPSGRSVRLGWTGPPGGNGAIRPGQRWRFEVRLKRPHATLNPGLFDGEQRAVQEGIAAVGSVRAGKSAGPRVLLDEFVWRPGTILERLRDRIRAAMLDALDGREDAASGVLIALAVGDQSAIPGEWWSRFNRTGVGHLMSISGLHITMLAALGGGLAGRLWSSRALASRMRSPLPARVPTPYVRWAAGLATGFAYAGLAGWGIPAQRTCWMLAAAGLALLSGRARSPVAVLSTAAAVVCLLDPWAPTASGFWLSFAAVSAIIWAGSARSAPSGVESGWRERLRALGSEATRSQFAATVSLLPLGAMFFSSVSLVGPIANAFSIPLVSAVVTPLALIGAALACLHPGLGGLVLWAGCLLSEWLLAALAWLDLDGLASLTIRQPTALALGLATVACVVLLAPVRFPARGLAWLALLPLLVAPPERPADDEVWLTALDIGQGTSVLVETAHGRLLYDTGPLLGPGNDAGARTIAPYLRARGIARLEALVISHEDADHSGGALSLMREIRVDWLTSSLPEGHAIVKAAPRHAPCLRGSGWHWGPIRFDWLHPAEDDPVPRKSPTNARSCVLRISAAGGTVLLAGDIEAPQERRLLDRLDPLDLRADVLLSPHHGSRTSSTDAFLETVQPRRAIFQVGYRNRYRHPNPVVLQRYLNRGIEIL